MVTPKKLVDEMSSMRKKEDIVDVIMKHCQKFRPKEQNEFLKPTLANLFGLEVRFKAIDAAEKHEKKKRAKRFELDELIGGIPSLKKVTEEFSDLGEQLPTKQNRHAVLARKLSAVTTRNAPSGSHFHNRSHSLNIAAKTSRAQGQ